MASIFLRGTGKQRGWLHRAGNRHDIGGHWKIRADDIHNRARRADYLDALGDMCALTSTEAAPWHIVPAEFKWFARVAVARTVVKGLGKGVALGPPALDSEVVKAAAEHLGRSELAALSLAMPVQTIR